MPEQPILSVCELNQYVRGVLEMHVNSVMVTGEISNFSCPASGHWYFTLKDDRAQIRCAMFRNKNRFLRNRINNGMQVTIQGKVSLYEARGDYQLIADYIEEAGFGALQRQFEQLKTRLAAEGLFAPQHKKSLPRHVQHVAVITSATGAAIRDILTVLDERFPLMRVTVIPTTVQGEQAARQICTAITLAQRWNEQEPDQTFDALIVGRGGGSIEDLWPFNEEIVARALFDCTIPLISAVGHETDTTIADYVADVRAATPSAAAEMISPDRHALAQQLDHVENTLAHRMENLISRQQKLLTALQHGLKHPGETLRSYRLQFAQLARQLLDSRQAIQQQKQHRLALAKQQLMQFRPQQQITTARHDMQRLNQALCQQMQRKLDDNRRELAQQSRLLDTVSPLATLQRGYSITSDENNHIIRDVKELKPGDIIQTRLHNGMLISNIKHIKE